MRLFDRGPINPAEVSEEIVRLHSTPRWRAMQSNPNYSIGLGDLLAGLNFVAEFRMARALRRGRKVYDQLTPEAQRWIFAEDMAASH